MSYANIIFSRRWFSKWEINEFKLTAVVVIFPLLNYLSMNFTGYDYVTPLNLEGTYARRVIVELFAKALTFGLS